MKNNPILNKRSKEKLLIKILSLIKKKPGIRPTKINHLLNLKHSASLRDTLIKQGLIRKERKGGAVYYYALDDNAKKEPK